MCIAAIIGMALWLLAAPAVAQEFFRGKTINMMVGFGPGAGMDTTARTIARHMPRFIPGAPNMLVQPMEGAAGLVAANYTARRAAPDGLTLSAPGRSFFVEAILKTPSVQFDPLELGYIGATGAQNTILWVAASTGIRDYKSLAASRDKIALGALGTGTPGAVVAGLLAGNGAPMKIVTGYTSAARLIIALAQGELQSVFLSEDSFATQREVLDNKVAIPILQSKPVLPGVALIRDVLGPEQLPVLALAQSGESLGLVIISPPRLPRDRLDVLRKAFVDMSADKEYRDDIARFDPARAAPLDGAEVTAFIADLVKTATPDAIAAYNKLRY